MPVLDTCKSAVGKRLGRRTGGITPHRSPRIDYGQRGNRTCRITCDLQCSRCPLEGMNRSACPPLWWHRHPNTSSELLLNQLHHTAHRKLSQQLLQSEFNRPSAPRSKQLFSMSIEKFGLAPVTDSGASFRPRQFARQSNLSLNASYCYARIAPGDCQI